MYLIVFFGSFIVYLTTLAPSITVGDSGEFCAASVILGLPHSPGYPLYCLLGKMVTLVLPAGSFAYRLNIMSALFAALAASVLYGLLVSSEKGDHKSRGIYAFSALLFALSPAFWRSGIQAEVFSLNALFAVLVMLAVQMRKQYLAVYIFGLGLGNHHTLVFMAPLLAIGFVKTGPVSLRRFLPLVACFMAGFSIYLYLSVRAFNEPSLNWGDPKTLHNLWRVISRADYGSLALTVGEKLDRTLPLTAHQLLRFATMLSQQFTLLGVLTGIIGWFWALKEKRAYAGSLLLTWLLVGPFFILLANVPFTAESDGVLERFFILVNLLWTVAIGWGLLAIFRNRFRQVSLAGLIAIPLLAGVRYPAINWRDYHLSYDYGRNILRTLAPNSVLFMDGGDDTFYSLAYLCFAERRRSDIELHDRGGLVFKSIYGHDFRRLGRAEKDKRRQETERAFLRFRPVYYSTFNRDVLPGVELHPAGLLYRAGSPGTGRAYDFYALRSVYEAHYSDYRSIALVPVYPYFAAAEDPGARLDYWRYAYRRWPEALWLGANLRIEMAQKAYHEFSRGRLDAAAGVYLQISALFPDDASPLVNLGVIEEKRGNPSNAKSYYQRAIELNPASTDAYYDLAVIYWKESNWTETVRYLEKLLSISPDDARARYYLPLAQERLKRSRQ